MTVRIMIGDVRDNLRELPDESVDCVVTSPPYWGLRDYGVDGQIGMERTLGEHIETLVLVFREVRRVIKPRACVWLNYGDCYATQPNGRSAADTKAAGNDDRTFRDKPFSTVQGVLKSKDLCLIPFRLAIALQEDQWWIRSRCIWGKPNGMPDSSGRYRPSVAHEEIFLLSKSGDLDYDFEAVKAPIAKSSRARYDQDIAGQTGSTRANAGRKTNGNLKAVGGPRTKQQSPAAAAETRLLRSYEPEVWHLATAAYGEAHFATFPPALVERCLSAGAKPGQTVLDPFGGAGTVGLVADRMGMDAILIELNPEYAALADGRIRGALGSVSSAPSEQHGDLPLFA